MIKNIPGLLNKLSPASTIKTIVDNIRRSNKENGKLLGDVFNTELTKILKKHFPQLTEDESNPIRLSLSWEGKYRIESAYNELYVYLQIYKTPIEWKSNRYGIKWPITESNTYALHNINILNATIDDINNEFDPIAMKEGYDDPDYNVRECFIDIKNFIDTFDTLSLYHIFRSHNKDYFDISNVIEYQTDISDQEPLTDEEIAKYYS